MKNETFFTHPGQVIEELLKKNHMTQQELSCRIGVSLKHMNEIIHQKKSLTAAMAIRLANVFDVSADFLLQLQSLYDQQKEELMNIMQMSEEEKVLASNLPYERLHQWGYAPKQFLTREERVFYFRKFIGVSSLQNIPVYMAHITSTKENVYHLAVWLRMGQWEASRIEIGNLNLTLLKKQLPSLRELMKLTLDEAIIPLSTLLASWGIALCLLPVMPDIEAMGFLKYHGEGVIMGLAEKFEYEDEFWLALYQMLGTLVCQRSKSCSIVYKEELLDQADAFAKKQWISAARYQRLVSHLNLENILDAASQENLLIGHLIGLLIDDGYLDKNAYPDFRRKKTRG